MAFTAAEYAELQRQTHAVFLGRVTKPKLNALVDAANDWFTGNRASFVTAINAAAALQGVTLSVAEIKAVAGHVLELRGIVERR